MINFGDYANENKTKHNLKWSYIPDHLCRILIIGGSGSGKANALLNLINKIYLYAKNPYEIFKWYSRCLRKYWRINPLRFSRNLLKEIYNKIITIHDQIRDEKLQ